MTNEALRNQISEIIKQALVEQDALTYHGQSGNVFERANQAAEKILEIVDRDQENQARKERMSPPDPSRMDLRGLLPGARSV